MGKAASRVLAGVLIAGMVAAAPVRQASANVEAEKTAQNGCLVGAGAGLSLITPQVASGAAFAGPIFATEVALLASPVVQVAAVAGVIALSFCYAGQAVAPLYAYLTADGARVE